MITITEPADGATFSVGSTITFKGTNGPVASVTVTAAEFAQFQRFPAAAAAAPADSNWQQAVGPFNTAGQYVVTVYHTSGRSASRTINIV